MQGRPDKALHLTVVCECVCVCLCDCVCVCVCGLAPKFSSARLHSSVESFVPVRFLVSLSVLSVFMTHNNQLFQALCLGLLRSSAS